MARLFSVDDLLAPLFDYVPTAGENDINQAKEQSKSKSTRRNSVLSNANATQASKEKKQREASAFDLTEINSNSVINNDDDFSNPTGGETSLSAQNFEFGDTK